MGIYATSISNIAIIKDAVVMLFLNYLDEQVFTVVRHIAPNWIDNIEASIMNETLTKLMHEISEIVDGDDKYEFGLLDKQKNEIDTCNGGSDYKESITNDVTDVKSEEVKQDLISEIMAIYNADKAKLMKTFKTEKDQILDEFKQVKDENSKMREENCKMKEENDKMKEENDKMKEENWKMKEENCKMKDEIVKMRMDFHM